MSAFIPSLADTAEQPFATEVEAELIEECAPVALAETSLVEQTALAEQTTPVALAETSLVEQTALAEEIPPPPMSHPALPPPPPVPSSLGVKSERPRVVAAPRTFTTTASDWPIAQVPSAPTVLLPEFGDRPNGAPDPTRFSLPAFLPPPGMLLEPSNLNAIIETARESSIEPVDAAPAAVIASPAVAAPVLAAPAPVISFISPVAPKPARADAGIVFVAPLGEDISSSELVPPTEAALAELNQPFANKSLSLRTHLQNLPRWACFAAGIGLGVIVTLLAT